MARNADLARSENHIGLCIPPGGGGGRKVQAPISTFENFLDI